MHPTRIGNVEYVTRGRIDLQETVPADRGFDGLDSGSHLRIVGRELQWVDESPKVETGTADDQGRRVLFGQLLQHPSSGALEFGHAKSAFRIDQIDHVMRDPLSIGRGRLGSANIHAPVHLHGVDGDNVGIEILGQTESEVALAGRRRSEERQYPAQSTVPSR